MATKSKSKKRAPVKKVSSAKGKTTTSTKASVGKPAKKSVKSNAPASSTKTTSVKLASPSSFKMRKSFVILIIVILLIGALAFKFRSFFVAAIVNGRPISRLAVVKETEKQAGKQALDNLVRNTLIEQEAEKQHVTVSDKEINDEIKKVEANLSKQGQKIDQVLALQGLTRDDLRRLIRLDKLVSKMVGKSVTVSDKDIDAYIEKNKDTLPQGQTPEQLRASVSSQLRQQALSAKVQSWLANLQSKAKIKYFVQY